MALLSQKDFLLDDIRHDILDSTDSPNCDVCNISHSWKRITVKSSDYEATINCCENCQHLIETKENSQRVPRYEIVCTDEVY